MSRVSKFILLLTTAIISLGLVGCTESEESTTLKGDLVLSAPTVTDNKSPLGMAIDFTVKMGGVDVSNNETLTIYCVDSSTNTTESNSSKFTPSTAGYYKFYATCVNTAGETVTSNLVIITVVSTSELVLTSSLSFVVKGATDEVVTLSLKLNNSTVAIDDENLTLYAIKSGKTSQLSSYNYTASDEADYQFYATYADEDGTLTYSNSVSVSTTSFNNIAYDKRMMAVQCTGTWCGWCPFMTSAIVHFEEKYGTDKVVFTAAHYGDIMDNDYAYSVITTIDTEGTFPRLFVGSLSRTYTYDISASSYYGAMSAIATAIGKLEDEPTNTAIAMSSTGNTSSFSVSAAIAVNTDGQYGVGAMILEDGIIAGQTSYYDSLADIDLEGYDTSSHHNVIQAISNTSSNLYANLGGTSSHTADTIYEFSWTVDTSKLTTLSDISNCRAVVYTVNKTTGYIDNVVQAPINTLRAFDSL